MLYRTPHLTESLDVARFIRMAGGGLYEFLFDNLVPLLSADELLAIAIASDGNPFSHRNCHVAVNDDNGSIIGIANAFPADLLSDPTDGLLPGERAEHIRPMLRLLDWGSMFLNALAVSDQCHGRGIGSHLLDWALTRARDLGLPRLSLHVWADNLPAREYYKARGFVDIGVADVAPHPRLPHRGGSVLMSRSSSCDA